MTDPTVTAAHEKAASHDSHAAAADATIVVTDHESGWFLEVVRDAVASYDATPERYKPLVVVPPLTAQDRRAITQRTGAHVRSLTTGQRGIVEGHYDDDSVYVRMDGSESVERWWTDDLRVVRVSGRSDA